MINTISKKQLTLFGGDIILIIASFYLSPLLRFGVFLYPASFLEWPDLSAVFTYLLFFYIFDFYNFDDRFQSVSYFFRFLTGLIVSDLVITSLFYVFNVRPYATVILLLNTVLILLLCLGWRFLFYRWRTQHRSVSRVLIIGAGPAGDDLCKRLESWSDFEVVGFLNDDQSERGLKIDDRRIVGGTELLAAVIRERNIDLIIIAITQRLSQDLYKRIMEAKIRGMLVYEMPTFCEMVLGNIPVAHVSDLWFVYVPISGFRKTTYNQKGKKVLDILFSMFVLAALSPLMLLTALAIKVDSRGPVFYIQRRIGWQGQPFNLVKFRSMRVGLENHREFAGHRNDPRITRVGKILRLTRFDEITQLWNVIKGEMSFIGPRALMEEEVKEFEPQIPYFSLRHSIKPGITGWAQINYPHGATVQDGLRKLEYDLYYIKNMSPFLDLIILARTVRTVLFGRGAR